MGGGSNSFEFLLVLQTHLLVPDYPEVLVMRQQNSFGKEIVQKFNTSANEVARISVVSAIRFTHHTQSISFTDEELIIPNLCTFGISLNKGPFFKIFLASSY